MIPLAENNIGNTSTVPGDVIKAYNGLNVEIVDTDAEGRLMLADTLSYGCKLYPKFKIIEFSTLTGEVEAFSCGKFSMAIGINYNNNEINKFVNIGEFNGERVIVLPFISGFDDELKSDIADIRNICKKCKGQLYPSTTFLSYFINNNTKYLHIDIAGTAFNDNKKYTYEHYESSGVGVKLIIDYLLN
jgi:leucyl aminopeptidase